MTSSTSQPLRDPVSDQQSWLTRSILKLPNIFGRILPEAGSPQLLWILLALLLLSAPLIVTPLEVWQQTVLAIFLAAVGWLIVKLEQKQTEQSASEYLHLFLAWLSMVTTLRYLYYRTSYTINLDGWVNGSFSLVLYAAELYAIGTLVLSYFQTLKLRNRTSIDISHIPQNEWLTVDVYIPTYNEDIEIVRKTVLAALAIDYPATKKKVYVLDDGRKYPERRVELQSMCDEVGAVMMVRDNNDHAKAGNINTAMRQTKGDLVLILDCDHIPSKQMLIETVGFFGNPKVALVQTPHWFYNPDPFERNLLTQGRVPVGNELFYKVVQRGNDFWNAAFFCGSAAVIRKDYVLRVGGIAVETVTEDCHTALRLHSLGYESVYYDKIMVAGLAPEKFTAYVGQQVRWARGMAQILRLENPLFNRKLKLTLPQRLCYFSATTHFFFGFPRLMYALAPVLYLLLGINLIRGLGFETLVYALPHILLAMNANYITYKNVRFSFWNEVLEYAMAFQDGIVTLMALVNPKLGSFNVTDKGLSVTKRSFDWESAKPTLIVVTLLIVSLLSAPFWLAMRPEAQEAILINSLWCVFNLLLLVAALLVAFEQPQLRRAHRLARELTTVIYGANQGALTGKTLDISESGARVVLHDWPNLPDAIEVEIVGDFGARAFLDAKVIRVTPLSDTETLVAFDFINMTQAQKDALVLVLYSDVKEWYSQKRSDLDRPFHSLGFLATGLIRAFQEPKPATNTEIRKQVNAAAQVYWDGNLYSGIAKSISSRSLIIEMDGDLLPSLEELHESKPPVGLLLSQHKNDDDPKKLIGQVSAVKVSELSTSGEVTYLVNRVAGGSIEVELTFPEDLDARQGSKIRQLLRELE